MGFNIAAAGQSMQGAFKQGEDAAALLLQQQQAKQAELTTGALPERLAQEAQMRKTQIGTLNTERQKLMQEMAQEAAKHPIELRRMTAEALGAENIAKLNEVRIKFEDMRAADAAEERAAGQQIVPGSAIEGVPSTGDPTQMAGGTPGETYRQRDIRTGYEARAAENAANVGRSELGLDTTDAARRFGVPSALAGQTVAEAQSGTAAADLSLLMTQARAKVWTEKLPSGKTRAEEFADASAKGDMAKVLQLTQEATVATEYAEKQAKAEYDRIVAQTGGFKSGSTLDNARAFSLLNPPPVPGTPGGGGGEYVPSRVRSNAQTRLQKLMEKFSPDAPPSLEDFGDPVDPKTKFAFMKGQKDYNSAQLKIRGLQATMDLADYMPQILEKGILLPSDAENPSALVATYGAFKGAMRRNPKSVDKALDETKVKVDAWRAGSGKQESALAAEDRKLEAGIADLPPREKAMELAWINGHGNGGFHRYTEGPPAGEEKRAAAAAVDRGDWTLFDKLLTKAHQHNKNTQAVAQSRVEKEALRKRGYRPSYSGPAPIYNKNSGRVAPRGASPGQSIVP